MSVRRRPLYILYWGTNLRPQFPVVHECDISSTIFADYVVRQYDALMCAFTRATCLDIGTKLSWQPHINKVQNKDRKTLGLIKRTLHEAPSQVRTTTHEVLVRPTLQSATCAWSPPHHDRQSATCAWSSHTTTDSLLLAPGHPTPRQTVCYLRLVTPHHDRQSATCAWSPHTTTDIQKVERVQRFAARFVTGDYRRTSCATAMRVNFVWDTQHTRRCITDATLFFFLVSQWTSSHQFAYRHCHSRCSHLDATTSVNSEHYQLPASSTSAHSYVRSIPIQMC